MVAEQETWCVTPGMGAEEEMWWFVTGVGLEALISVVDSEISTAMGVSESSNATFIGVVLETFIGMELWGSLNNCFSVIFMSLFNIFKEFSVTFVLSPNTADVKSRTTLFLSLTGITTPGKMNTDLNLLAFSSRK
jgi:hypothetical protein